MKFIFLRLLLILLTFFSQVTLANSLKSYYSDLEHFREESLSLQNKKSTLESSSALLTSKQLFWTPTLSANLNQQSQIKDEAPQISSHFLDLKLQWNLFQGGGSWHELNSAKNQYKSSELSLFNEGLQVEIQASNLIFKSIYLRELERASEEILKLKEETLKITTTRYHQGKLPHHELIKAEVDLNKQKIILREDRLNVEENSSEIQSFFIDKLNSSNWPFTESNLPIDLNANSDQLTNSLVEEKLWTSKLYEDRWKSSRSLHSPTLDFDLSFEKNLDHDRTQSWIGTLTLSFPLWNRYETSSRQAQSYADYQIAMNDYKLYSQQWKNNKNYLQKKILSNKENLIEAKNNLSLIKELYKEVSKAFQVGRISVNDLFLEQSRLIEAQNSLSQSQLAFHQSLVEFCARSGKRISECIK